MITPCRLFNVVQGAAVSYDYFIQDNAAIKPYSTVSHVWGQQEANRLPGVDWAVRMGPGSVYQKQGRLATACRKYGVTHVWWDAYCINQADPREVENETQKSAAFYRQSKLTFALLNDVGYRLLSRLTSPEHITVWSAVVRAGRNRNAASLLGLLLPSRILPHVYSYSDPTTSVADITEAGDLLKVIRLVRDICLDAWFNRVWLIQEMKVARNVILVGDAAEMPLGEFMSAVEGIKILRNYANLHLGRSTGLSLEMLSIWELHASQLSMPLGEALRFSSTRACTRPEDRLFAVLSMLSEPHNFHVSYASGSIEQQINEYFRDTGDASFMLFDGPASPLHPHLPDPANLSFIDGRLWTERLIGARSIDNYGASCTFQLYARVVFNLPINKLRGSTGIERLKQILRPLTGDIVEEFDEALSTLRAADAIGADGCVQIGINSVVMGAYLCRIIDDDGAAHYTILYPNNGNTKTAGPQTELRLRPNVVLYCVGPQFLTEHDTFLVVEENHDNDVGWLKRIGLAKAFIDMPMDTVRTVTGYLR